MTPSNPFVHNLVIDNMLFNLFDTEDASVASHAAATNTNNTNTKAKNQTSKRSQVKNACVNCQKACKKCDDGRPCQRCIKLGLTDTCVNSPRKERKKGLKRGPYRKRVRKDHKTSPAINKEQVTNQQPPYDCMAMFLNFPITETPPEMAYTNCFSNNNEKNVMLSNAVVVKEQRNKNTILNSTSSPSSSPKSVDSFQDDDNNNNNSKVTIPHVHPSNHLSLCDNALFSLPKAEGMSISSSHLGTDAFSCLSPNELIDQWLKSTDGQELFT
ncbi:Putative Potential fungal zinc cluster transcription factor [Rhizopus microsporus]|nr:Putative Potential fungal zinc cluster transcription factor [Rhizopus microsporus]